MRVVKRIFNYVYFFLLQYVYLQIIPKPSLHLRQTYSVLNFVRGRSASAVMFRMLFEARYLKTSKQQLKTR